MKAKKIIRVVTKSYEEQQFILNRFPDSYWVVDGEKTRFYIDTAYESAVYSSVIEWYERNKK